MNYNKLINGTFTDEELKNILVNPLVNKPSIEKAIELSLNYKIPLHPEYLFYWNEISPIEFVEFLDYLKDFRLLEHNNNIELKIYKDDKFKRVFEIVGIPHKVVKKDFEDIESEKWSIYLFFDNLTTKTLLANFGLYDYNKSLDKLKEEFLKKLEKTKVKKYF